MEGGEPPGSLSSAVMTTIAAPLAAGVANAPVAPTIAAIPSPGSSTIAPPPSDTPSTSILPSVPISSLAYTSPSSSSYPISTSPSFPSSPPSSMPAVSTLEQQEEHYQNQDIPHHDHHLQEQQQQQQQQQQHQQQQQQQQQPQQDHGQQQQQQLKQQQQHIISLYHSPASTVDRRIYFPPSRESRRTFRAEDGRCYFLPKCIHFRPVSSKHAKASLHLQVSAGVYLCNGERCSEKGGNVDFRATPIITKKQVLVFRAFRNLLGWRPIGELPVVLHELLASEVFRLWEKTRRVLDEHAPPISDDEIIRISPPLNKVSGGNAVAATVPAPAIAPTPTTPVAAPFSEPATPPPSHSPSTVSGTPAPPAPAVAAPTPAGAAVPAGAASVDPAPAPASTSANSFGVELVMRAGELRRVSRDKRRRCNDIYERLLTDETVLSGTLEESPTGELPTAADKKAAEKALAAATAGHRRILPAHRLNEAAGLTAAGVSAPMDVVIGGIQGARGGLDIGCGFGPSSYDMKLQGGSAAGHHGPDIQCGMNGPVIGAVAQFGSPSLQHHARNGNGTFLGGGGSSATTYRPLLDGRAIFTCGGVRGGGDSGTADLGLGRPSVRDVDDGSVHQHQRRNSYANRSSPHGGAAENGGGANGLRYSSTVTPGGSLGSPAAKRQRVDTVERKPTDDTASTKFGGAADGANNNGHAVAGGGSARGEADTGIPPAGGSEDPASAARRQIWFREVQLNDARLQELRERAEREHARRRSELMSWMVDEEGGKHSGLGPNAGPEPASWDYGA